MFKSFLIGLVSLVAVSNVFGQHKVAHQFDFKYHNGATTSPSSAVGDTLVSTAADTIYIGLKKYNSLPETVTLFVNSIDISNSENLTVTVQRGTTGSGGVWTAGVAGDILTVTAGSQEDISLDINTGSGSARQAEALRVLISQAGSPAGTDSAGYVINAIGSYTLSNPVH